MTCATSIHFSLPKVRLTATSRFIRGRVYNPPRGVGTEYLWELYIIIIYNYSLSSWVKRKCSSGLGSGPQILMPGRTGVTAIKARMRGPLSWVFHPEALWKNQRLQVPWFKKTLEFDRGSNILSAVSLTLTFKMPLRSNYSSKIISKWHSGI